MASKPTPTAPKLLPPLVMAVALLLPLGYLPAALTVAVAPMTSYQPLRTAFPNATFDATTRIVSIPAAGSGYPAKITVRVGASSANLVGQTLVINNPFGSAPVVVVPPVIVPPAVVLTTGLLPFSATWLSQTGTLPSGKLKRLFQEDVTNDAIETYVTSSTPTTDVDVDYPDGFFLDNLVLYDGGDSALGAGTQPLQFFYLPKGSSTLVKLGEFDGSLFNVDLPPLVPAGGRAVRRLTTRMTGSHAVWPRRIHPNGAFPQSYRPPAYVRKGASLAAQFGMNTYGFYVTDPLNFAAGPKPEWVADLDAFDSKRAYMDVADSEDLLDDSILRFQPSYKANWDKMLAAMPGMCIALTGNFRSNKATFPDPNGDPANNAVWPLGVDRLSPEAYRKRGAFVYQLFARWGKVQVADANLRTAGGTTAHGWTGEEVHQRLSGLNYQFRLMVANEFFKYWKTLDAQGTGAEAAVLYAVCLDGYNNTMGPLVGARNADPSAEVEVQMLFEPNLVEINAFFDKLGSIYGYNADGSVKNAPRYMDCHWYSRDAASSAGVAWENSGLQADLDDLQTLLAVKAPGCQVTLSEFGYSYDSYADRSYVAPAGGLTSAQRTCAFYLSQGFNNVRNDIASAHGYDWRRGQGAQPTGPGVPWDVTCDVYGTLTPDAVRDVRALFAGYLFAEALDQGAVRINRHTKAGQPDLYEVYGTGTFTLPVAGATHQTRFVPTLGGWGSGVTTAVAGVLAGTAAGEMMNYYRAS